MSGGGVGCAACATRSIGIHDDCASGSSEASGGVGADAGAEGGGVIPTPPRPAPPPVGGRRGGGVGISGDPGRFLRRGGEAGCKPAPGAKSLRSAGWLVRRGGEAGSLAALTA